MIFLRKILQISAIIVALFGVVFFTDLGRSIFLNSVVFFLKTKNVELIVEGVDGRKIRKIFIRSADKTELTLLNVIWNQNSFFDKLSIGIDDFIFKKDNFRDGSVGNSGKVLLWISKIKEFIKDFSVTNGSLCFSDKVYSINNFCYESREDKDHLSVKIGDWNLRYLSAVAKSSATAYEFSAENDKIKIAAVGRFDDFMSEIKIDTVAAEYQNFVQKGQGYLCLSRRNANIKTEIDCENFLNLISPILVENFKNLRAHSDINFDFTNGLTCRADSVLKKNAASVGNLKCFYEKGKIKITSNVSGIRVFGFGFSGIDCKINEEKMADITLFGEDFKIISNIKIRDRIFVENFELTCPKGTVKSSGSFFIGEECCFDFDFNQLDFWNRIFPISGSGSGNFSCKNGMIFGKGKFPKLILNNKKFSSLNFSVSEKKILAVAESAKIFGIELKDLNFETSDHNFNLYAKVNETGILNAAGEIRKSFKKILLKNAEIKFPSCKIKIENSLSDATKNRYWINCTLSDKKKLGEVKADYANEAVTVDFSSFPLDKFLSIFNYNMPSCRLSGSINLKAENGNFIGE
ncbi:MAG: hypothetical protein LBJ96_06210, partial [Holosporaceae bacterium]|nr:hypothetical protein [Holosporaceae bacterium]